MARNCAIENGCATSKGLHDHQHCEVLMGERVAESLETRKVPRSVRSAVVHMVGKSMMSAKLDVVLACTARLLAF